jgi:hypothetical protein
MAAPDKIPASIILETVFEHSAANPRDLVHIAVGSSPRVTNLGEFNPIIDQLLPMFILKEIETTTKTIRIIHIDEFTERALPFLHQYFDSFASKGLNFKHDDSEGMNVWTTDDHRIEIIFVFVSIYYGNRQYNGDYPDDTWFLEKMIENTLQNKNQLIVQQYTGFELKDLFKILYQSNSNKDLFKEKILFDITYGNDCSCMTDMTKHFPKYKPNGNFYNFLLYDYEEMRYLIGIDDKINNILNGYFLKQYKQDIDIHHINYRRKITGNTLMYNFPEYNESTPPDEIMSILIAKIQFSITIFDLLGLVTDQKKKQINDLLTNYHIHEMYKWRETMMNMFNEA